MYFLSTGELIVPMSLYLEYYDLFQFVDERTKNILEKKYWKYINCVSFMFDHI